MSWTLSIRRADSVKQGDLVLAQWEGLIGPWRVTDASMGKRPASEERVAVTLTLVEQGQTGKPPMMQLHDERALVFVLCPLPEPDPLDIPEQLTRLLLIMELERLERMGYESHGIGADRHRRIDELRQALGWLP